MTMLNAKTCGDLVNLLRLNTNFWFSFPLGEEARSLIRFHDAVVQVAFTPVNSADYAHRVITLFDATESAIRVARLSDDDSITAAQLQRARTILENIENALSIRATGQLLR